MRVLDVAQSLVDAVFVGAGKQGVRYQLPISVVRLVQAAGIETIYAEHLDRDGLFIGSSERSKIIVRGSHRNVHEYARQRFTLAHEVGHLLLSDPDVHAATRAALGGEPIDIESLCDAVAAELLMPRKYVERFAEEKESFDVLDQIVRETDVSLSAALVRLSIVLGWSSSLIYFQRRRRWAPIHIAAGRPIQRHNLRLAQGTVERLVRFSSEGPRYNEEVLALRVYGSLRRIPGELRHSDAGALFFTRASLGPRTSAPSKSAAGSSANRVKEEGSGAPSTSFG